MKDLDKAAEEWVTNNPGNWTNQTIFKAGAQWQEQQDRWIPVGEAAELLNSTDEDLIICKFDNGDIISFTSEFSFAEMTHIFILPTPPTDK